MIWDICPGLLARNIKNNIYIISRHIFIGSHIYLSAGLQTQPAVPQACGQEDKQEVLRRRQGAYG